MIEATILGNLCNRAGDRLGEPPGRSGGVHVAVRLVAVDFGGENGDVGHDDARIARRAQERLQRRAAQPFGGVGEGGRLPVVCVRGRKQVHEAHAVGDEVVEMHDDAARTAALAVRGIDQDGLPRRDVRVERAGQRCGEQRLDGGVTGVDGDDMPHRVDARLVGAIPRAEPAEDHLEAWPDVDPGHELSHGSGRRYGFVELEKGDVAAGPESDEDAFNRRDEAHGLQYRSAGEEIQEIRRPLRR